jgi:hypothetical protein
LAAISPAFTLAVTTADAPFVVIVEGVTLNQFPPLEEMN